MTINAAIVQVKASNNFCMCIEIKETKNPTHYSCKALRRHFANVFLRERIDAMHDDKTEANRVVTCT